MAAVYKVLGQAVAINVTNLTDNQATYNLHVVKSGGSVATSNALVYGATITGRDVHSFTQGITLAAGDRIYASCNLGTTITVQVFGSEIA
jgi:hypothetical protein